MNFYPHHIGDFNNATRHLTRVEQSVYRGAIEHYYDTEQPLNGGDVSRLEKRLLCVTDEEKTALRDVLAEFFIEQDGFYSHARCNTEIAKYRANTSAKAKAGIASAAARQQKSTAVEQPLNTCATNQEPITNNQEPVIKEPKGSLSTSFPPCPHEKLLNLFAEHCPELPQPRIELWKTGKNGKAMRDRWIWVLTAKKSNGDPYASNSSEALAWFGRYFGYIAKSDFLMGVGTDWNADLGWLVNRSNFEKVLQGNYENKDKK